MDFSPYQAVIILWLLTNYTFSGHSHPLGVAEATPYNRCQEKRGIISLLLIHQRAMRRPPTFFLKAPRLSSPVVKDFNFKYVSKEIRFRRFFFTISLVGFGVYVNVFLKLYSFSFELVYSGYQVGAQPSLKNLTRGLS